MEEKDKYIEKLSKKNPIHMKRFELEDWLDYIIYRKMKYHTFSDIQKDTFNHILIYFRLLHMELHLIKAIADINRHYIRSLMLVMKETNPKMVDTILEMVDNMEKERQEELIKDESPESQLIIKQRAKELTDKAMYTVPEVNDCMRKLGIKSGPWYFSHT